MREALEKEWEEESDEEEEEKEDGEEDEEEEEDQGQEKEQVFVSENNELITIGGELDNVKRRVSWAQPSLEELPTASPSSLLVASPDQRICFLHSAPESDSAENHMSAAPWPITPGQIGREAVAVKSILKKSTSDVVPSDNWPYRQYGKTDDTRDSVSRRQPEARLDNVGAAEPFMNPVCDTVIEKHLPAYGGVSEVDTTAATAADSGDAAAAAKPKLSKFKAMRSNK